MLEKVLLSGEQVGSRVSFGGVTIAASNRGIFIARGSTVTVVPPRHVHAITVSRNLTLLVAGILILVLGIPIGIVLADIVEELGLIVILTSIISGITLAIYGYLRRYQLTMIFAGGSITLKGSGKIIDTAKQLRKLTEI